MNSLQEIWNNILALLKRELSQTALDTWFSSAELVDLDNNSAVICAANDLAKEVIEKRFSSLIAGALEELFCQKYHILVLSGSEERRSYLAKKEGREGFRALTIPAYSFSDFVVGSSNRFAYGIAKVVSENPGERAYNPLFIYGPAGTGKTHLLCATALKIHESFPGKRIMFIRGDEFTNRLVKAIKNGTTEQFREEFRTADILMIDDIQFVMGKPATQEELYNTFNALYESGKHIIMTSDVPPEEMPVLEDRLKTRFEGGVVADIRPPEEALRADIIRLRNAELRLGLSESDVSYIAAKPFGSIRQIEGVLKGLSARKNIFGFLSGSDIDEALSRHVAENCSSLSAETIITGCAEYYKVSEKEMKGLSRTRAASGARQLAMYLMRTELGMTLEEIGEIFSRDHATVVASVRKVSKLLGIDEAADNALKSVKKKISAA